MTPEISLVLLSYNNWHITKECIQSLLQSLDEDHIQRGIEIIIVDNGSVEETRQGLQELMIRPIQQGIELRVEFLQENLGYPIGINAGLAVCRGSFIGVLNNDLLFPKGWLTPLLQILQKDKSVGFAAPFLSYGVGLQNVNIRFKSLESMQDYATRFMNHNSERLLYVHKVTGACLLFRSDLLARIGGNDFWYGVGNYDDDDWCIRARIAGYKLVIVGQSFVHHIRHATFQTVPSLFSSSLEMNAVKFRIKWNIDSLNYEMSIERTNEIIANTAFDKAKHYVPIRVDDYHAPVVRKTPPSLIHRSLLCADWTSPQSHWRRTLISLSTMLNDPIELYAWIPESIFDVEQITNEIHQNLGGISKVSIHVLRNAVHYCDTLQLISTCDAVIQVDDDFVNRHIVRLAEHIDVKVITFR